MKHMSPTTAGILRRSWVYVRAFEPARLRAVWVALVGLAATLGVGIPAGVDTQVQVAITAAATLIPLLQGEWTRAAVYSPAMVTAIATTPGYIEHTVFVEPLADDGSVED